MIIHCTLTLIGCCQSPPVWKPADWWLKNSLRHSFITFRHPLRGESSQSSPCEVPDIELGHRKIMFNLSEYSGRKKASVMKIYCVKHIMIKRLTPLQTQPRLSVIWALWGQLYVHLKKQRVKATTPEWLMYFWSQMQCPAVNLMISPSKYPLWKVRVIVLVTRLVRRRAGNACDLAVGDMFLILAARYFSPYPEATALPCLITSLLCPTATHYIKRLHCLFTAVSVRPIWGSSFVLVDAHSMLWHSLLMGWMCTEGHQLIWVTRFSKEQIFDSR